MSESKKTVKKPLKVSLKKTSSKPKAIKVEVKKVEEVKNPVLDCISQAVVNLEKSGYWDRTCKIPTPKYSFPQSECLTKLSDFVNLITFGVATDDGSYCGNTITNDIAFDFEVSDDAHSYIFKRLDSTRFWLYVDKNKWEYRLLEIEKEFYNGDKLTFRVFRTLHKFDNLLDYYNNLRWIVLLRKTFDFRIRMRMGYGSEFFTNSYVCKVPKEYIKRVLKGECIQHRSLPDEVEITYPGQKIPDWYPKFSFELWEY